MFEQQGASLLTHTHMGLSKMKGGGGNLWHFLGGENDDRALDFFGVSIGYPQIHGFRMDSECNAFSTQASATFDTRRTEFQGRAKGNHNFLDRAGLQGDIGDTLWSFVT